MALLTNCSILATTVNAVVNVAPNPFTTPCKTIRETAINAFCNATGIPNCKHLYNIAFFIFKFSFVSLKNVVHLTAYIIHATADINCANAVATATPTTPHLNWSTKSKSNTTFIKLATIKNVSGVFVSPSCS